MFAPSPEGGADAPLAGAMVQLVVDDDVRDLAMTDEAGAYRELAAVFGGFGGHDTHIEVRVQTSDGRTASYSTIYEDTMDPTVANPSCESPCPPVYLNFSLATLPVARTGRSAR
jgi:hypothetical protein